MLHPSWSQFRWNPLKKPEEEGSRIHIQIGIEASEHPRSVKQFGKCVMLSGAERRHMHLRFLLFVKRRGRHRMCMGTKFDFRYRECSHKVVLAMNGLS